MTTVDKYKLKITVATSIVVILFIIITSTALATWKAEVCAEHKELDDRVTHVGEKHIELRVDIEALEIRANDKDVQFATISTQLAGIQTSLIEIKDELKNE